MFEDYTWDTGDFARKEIVRYMSDPGQATAYMIGRLELIKMRQKATKELGKKFNLKEFHYQVFILLFFFALHLFRFRCFISSFFVCLDDSFVVLCTNLNFRASEQQKER